MARDREPARPRGTRLDQPRTPRRGLRRPMVSSKLLGDLADGVARYLGSWKFIGQMTVIIVVWIGWNALAPSSLSFDEYPFTFLVLALSLQASYAAPLILLAQNRQVDRDRVQYEQDRSTTDRNLADTEYLTREVAALRIAVGEVATRDFVRSELQRVLEELEASRPEPESEHTSSS